MTQRQTKILATLGPASANSEMIEKLITAGVNAFRLNFSHGSAQDHQATADLIRTAEEKSGRPVTILADLQGPKLRIGTFKDDSIPLTIGQSLIFDLDDTPGDETRIGLPHPEILKTLEVGSQISLDDGKVRANITKTAKDHVVAEITAGSKLSSKKGVNLPGTHIPIPALTEKDKADLKTALEIGADWIAQSFVQTPDDVREALDLIDGRAALMAKLEKPGALDHLDEILELADGVMIARGDLGVEIPAQKVPVVQKDIIDRARTLGKPVVVATQMLESMISNPQPTRAEVSDVATAVFDGADAVMLSAETAVGDYPIEAVSMMDATAREIETNTTYLSTMERRRDHSAESPSQAITAAAYNVARNIDAAFIVTYTSSGSTALRMARQRPHVPILCLTPDLKAARRLGLSFGVNAVYAPETDESDFTGPARFAGKIAREQNFAKDGENFVMTAGIPFAQPGSTNILRIAKVEE